MFRQHLKCSLTAPRRAGTTSGFFCFFLLRQLSEPGRLGTALSGPVSPLASAMTFSGCDTSPTVDCWSFSICPTQSPEELGRVGERSLGWTDCRAATLTFFFFFFLMLTRRRGLGERGDKILRWRRSNCTHHDACMMQRRDSVSVPRNTQKCEQEDWAAVCGSERIARYRLDQSRVEAYTTDVYFYTQSLQRPHEGRPMASRREQVSVLFFVAWTQRRLTECFPWATEGPNPPKEKLIFKKKILGQSTSGSLPAGPKDISLYRGVSFFCSKLCWKKLSTSAGRIDFKFYMNILLA